MTNLHVPRFHVQFSLFILVAFKFISIFLFDCRSLVNFSIPLAFHHRIESQLNLYIWATWAYLKKRWTLFTSIDLVQSSEPCNILFTSTFASSEEDYSSIWHHRPVSNTVACKVWAELYPKVALELCHKEMQQFSHLSTYVQHNTSYTYSSDQIMCRDTTKQWS